MFTVRLNVLSELCSSSGPLRSCWDGWRLLRDISFSPFLCFFWNIVNLPLCFWQSTFHLTKMYLHARELVFERIDHVVLIDRLCHLLEIILHMSVMLLSKEQFPLQLIVPLLQLLELFVPVILLSLHILKLTVNKGEKSIDHNSMLVYEDKSVNPTLCLMISSESQFNQCTPLIWFSY